MSARKHYMTLYSEVTGERIISPGEILTKELKRQHITQKELAVLLGRSEKFISQLITGKVRLTYDVAYDLNRALKVPTSKWNAAEAAFQDELTRQQRFEELKNPDTLKWVETFPYKAMAARGMVPATNDPAIQAHAILNLLGVANVEAFNDCMKQEKGLSRFKQIMSLIDGLR